MDLSKALDFAAIVRTAEETRAGLICVDALDDVLGERHDGKGNAETRRALAPIRVLARQTGATVLGLRHPTKRVALGPALNNGNGSVAYGAVARGSLLVTIDPEDPETRLLMATKSNLSRLAATLRFQLVSDSDDSPPKIVWKEGEDPRTADRVLADLRAREQENPSDTEQEASKVEHATGLLREWLGDRWLPVSELESLARQRGVAPKTLRRAKEGLELQYHREGFGKGSRLVCGLPNSPYSPTPRDMGEHGGETEGPGVQLAGEQGDGRGSHTRPSHTRPSARSSGWASMTTADDVLPLDPDF